jgi:hypothetical protein
VTTFDIYGIMAFFSSSHLQHGLGKRPIPPIAKRFETPRVTREETNQKMQVLATAFLIDGKKDDLEAQGFSPTAAPLLAPFIRFDNTSTKNKTLV